MCNSWLKNAASEFSNVSTGIYILAQVQSVLLAPAVLYIHSQVQFYLLPGSVRGLESLEKP